MKRMIIPVMAICLFSGCGGGSDSYGDTSVAEETPLLSVETPEPLVVPEPRTVQSDSDWEAKVHNKEIEVLQVINIINPVAAYITVGFEQYGDRFSDVLNEEWADTQVHLTKALTLYDSCKARKEAGSFDKQLFLDMEEVWQLLVKTGVAGIRTKSMIDAEVKRIIGL